MRLARLESENDTRIFLDLGREDWRAVEISRDGWRIVKDPPVRFRRPPSLLPLPEPVEGVAFGELRAVMNVPDENWPLVAGYALGMLQPDRPTPILQLAGEQGTGKTSAARRLKDLIDPSKGGLRAEPREIGDLMVGANQSWVLAFDNLSRVSPALSDALCRLATGGGISKRKLYTDSDEHVSEATRTVILTGINDLATRSDLLDRMLIITLERIGENDRRTDADLQSHYERVRAGVLGALLTAAAKALRDLDGVKLESKPRMADFSLWVIAGIDALGVGPDEFLQAYERNRSEAHYLALESSVLPMTILRFMEDRRRVGKWVGSPTVLLRELSQTASAMDEKPLTAHDWPNTPIHLSGLLKRFSPNLRALGLEVRASRSGGERKWILEWMLTDSKAPIEGGTPGTIGTSENTTDKLEETAVKIERSEVTVQDGQKARTVMTDPMLEKLYQHALTTRQNAQPADSAESCPRIAERPVQTVSEADIAGWFAAHKAGNTQTVEGSGTEPSTDADKQAATSDDQEIL